MIKFTKNKQPFTLGAEIELQVLDAASFELVPKAHEFIANANHGQLTKELFKSMLEVITRVHQDVSGIAQDLEHTYLEVEKYAEQNGMRLSSTGTHPTADYNDRIITDSPRYQQLIDRNQWLSRRTSVYGLHVHIGMRNGDDCIAFSNFLVRQLPLFLAISASAPFWNKKDSGLATTRPTVYESIPTCGMPYLFKSWKQFKDRYKTLIKINAIESMKDLWWDIRPSPGYGTLEIRACDAPATLAETEALVALIHLFCLWYDDHKIKYLQGHPFVPARWILRENKWRVIRYGLDALYVDESTNSNIPIKDYILRWLETLTPYANQLSYGPYLVFLKELLQKGNSSERQKKVFNQTGSLEAVMQFNTEEFKNRQPLWNLIQ